MLQNIVRMIEALIELISQFFSVLTENIKGIFTLIKLAWTVFYQISTKVFDIVKTPLGIIGIIFVTGAIAVFAGSVWEAVN